MAFKIVRNDITKIKADAIVNTANPEPVYMAGTDTAIYMAAGSEKLLEARKEIGRIGEGEVGVTPAFNLQAEYIFHTVGPVWEGGDKGERETVRNCYVNCLNKAKELGLTSIAFPLIATGTYGFPKTEAFLIATSAFSSFLAENELDITLVVFDSESYEISKNIFAGIDQYIDENYVKEKFDEEYSLNDEICIDGAALEKAPEDEEPPRTANERRRGNRAPRGLFGNRKREAAEDRMRDMPFAGAVCASEAKRAVPPAAGAGAAAASSAMAAAVPASAIQPKRSLEDVVKNVGETWQESLLRLIIEKGYSDTEVYKRANVDRKLFSKIRSNKNYQPKKATAVAFALALRLNLDETKDFLRCAGYAFSPSSIFDLIIQFSIEHGIYNFMDINCVLEEYGEPQLGD